MTQPQRVSALTVGELDIHLGYIQTELGKIADAIPNMATKDDIRALETRMAAFATKEELKAVEAKLQAETVSSTFERWTTGITRVASAFAAMLAMGAAIAALVHFLDRVPKP